jgi:hypothetical protein
MTKITLISGYNEDLYFELPHDNPKNLLDRITQQAFMLIAGLDTKKQYHVTIDVDEVK